MKTKNAWTVRQATPADKGQLQRLIRRAERVVLRFQADRLADHLLREPFLLAQEAQRLRGFLAFFPSRPPQAALTAAGLADDWAIAPWLDRLLPPCIAHLRDRGVTSLSYTGSATWLIKSLQARGFRPLSNIVAYEKSDATIPALGNQTVHVRPVCPADLSSLAALDALAFLPPWRNTIETLQQRQTTLPYFVVALAGQEPVGYCYCAIEKSRRGHLIRIAVHPAWQNRGIGTRLLAEATRFFQHARVRSITLNTQQENQNAQRLYRKFGFRLIGHEAIVLWMDV